MATATIVHHNGSDVVEDYHTIEELDAEQGKVRVWFSDPDEPDRINTNYVDFHGATVTKVVA